MNNIKHHSWYKSLFLKAWLFIILGSFSLFSAHAVEPITVQGNKILYGSSDSPIAGNSFFWSNSGFNSEPFYNASVVRWLSLGKWHSSTAIMIM